MKTGVVREVAADIFHRTVGRAIVLEGARRNRRELLKLNEGDYWVNKSPVFVSQLGGARHELIEKPFGRISDIEAMERFGARDLEEFSYWAWRSCAVSDLQMILMTIGDVDFRGTTMDLVTECLNSGGYDVKTDTGWYHDALVKTAQQYGLTVERRKYLSLEELAVLIHEGNFVIGSVESETETSTPSHMLLLYGFRMDDRGSLDGFYYHNPDTYKGVGKQRYVERSEFGKIFTGKAVVVRGVKDK